MIELIAEYPVANSLGEGVLWEAASGCFWWTDIEGCQLYRLDLAQDHIDVFPTPERLSAFAFCTDAGLLLAAFASGFALFDYASGKIDWLHRPAELQGRGLRLNDGRLDPVGRFWCGAMVEDPAAAPDCGASLYCLASDRSLVVKQHHIRIANGLCWSPSGDRMYFTDSPTGAIVKYDYDCITGDISNPEPFIRTREGCHPDGAVTDSKGFIWSAQWGGGRVIRFRPDGGIDLEVGTPALQPTCVAFGGGQLDLLAVTSARQGLSRKTLRQDPSSGNLFIFKTNCRGNPQPLFKD